MGGVQLSHSADDLAFLDGSPWMALLFFSQNEFRESFVRMAFQNDLMRIMILLALPPFPGLFQTFSSWRLQMCLPSLYHNASSAILQLRIPSQ